MSLGEGMVIPILPLLAAVYGVDPALAAQVVTAQLVGRLLSLIPGGIFVDRAGTRVTMLLGTGMVAVASLVTAYAPAFAVLLVAQAFAGIGSSLWQAGREIAVVEESRASQRGRLLSAFFGIAQAAQAFGPVVGGLLADNVGLQMVFLVQAVASALTCAQVLLARLGSGPATRAKEEKSAEKSPSAGLSAVPQEFRATFYLLMFGTFAASTRLTVLRAILPLYTIEQLGFSATETGYLFGIVGVVNLLMIGPAGYVSDRFGRKAATVPAAMLSAGAFAAYPLASTFEAQAAVSGLLGIAGGFALGSMTTYSYDIIPASARGRLQGIRRIAGESGGLSGSSLGGLIAAVAAPALVFAAFAPLHLASGLLLLLFARESNRRAWRPGKPV